MTDLLSHLQSMGANARSAFLSAPSKLTSTFTGGKDTTNDAKEVEA